MNSWRDSVKDVLGVKLGELGIELDELPAEIADDIFDALGIVEDEQDMIGGYFMHHAGQKAEKKNPVDMFLGLNLVQKIIIAEKAINNAFQPYEKAHLVRKLFLDMFRAADGVLDEALSADDCYEIFQSILKGSSDLTYKTLLELTNNYDGGHEDFCLLPMNDDIRNALSVEEAMHHVMREIMKDKKQADGKTVSVEHGSIKKDGVDRSEF